MLLSFGDITPAWCCLWGQRNEPYLDISIQKTTHKLIISLYRKRPFTDSIIPYNSNHPAKHKYAAVKFLYNRRNSYSLQGQEYKQERIVIHYILHNNSFPITPQKQIPKNTARQQLTQNFWPKWVTFKYIGTYITNALKNTDLKIAFLTNNTIENLLWQRIPIPDKFSSSGVYKLTCPGCHKTYIGQTKLRICTGFKEHQAVFLPQQPHFNFRTAPPGKAHSFGPIDNSMQVLNHQKKRAHINTIEIFHIHVEQAHGNHLNDDHTVLPNEIFDILIKIKTPLTPIKLHSP